MTSKQKIALVIFGALALLGGAAFAGLSPFIKGAETIIQQHEGSSSTGSTFNTAKVAEIIMAPITSSATSSSILNTDANARVIDSGFVSCATSSQSVNGLTAGGVATWNWQMATTAVASLGLQGNTNYAMNMQVGTSTIDNSYAASSTQTVLNVSRYWPANTYLTIATNATSSQTQLSCQAGVYYHGS